MSFTPKEVPSWAINGVNKVFTLLNTPSQIDDVFVDGVIYTDFTSVGNIITMTDAPALSVFVDYWTGSSPVPVTSNVTFWDIKAKVWNLLGQNPTSTTFSDAVVSEAINAELKRVIKGRVSSKLDSGRIYRAGSLWFMNGSFTVRKYDDLKLALDYNVGDTSISIEDTTTLLAAGYVEIGGEVVRYTSKTATTLEGVSGGTINHLANEAVIQLFEAPEAMDKPSSVTFIPPYPNTTAIPLPYLTQPGQAAYYQVIRTNALRLIKISGVQNQSVVDINYQIMATNMTSDTDLCILPEDYGITVLAYLVAGQFAFEKGMPNAQAILLSAYSALQNMYQDFTNDIIITKQKIAPTAYSNFRPSVPRSWYF